MDKPKFLARETLLAMVKNSVGTHQYRNVFIQRPDGTVEDATQDGVLSCAVFVSGVLATLGLIDRGHATVVSTVANLEKAGWQRVELGNILMAGDVLVWEEQYSESDTSHKHIGFYIGDNRAISNSESQKTPIEHDWQYDGRRSVEQVWRFDFENWSRE